MTSFLVGFSGLDVKIFAAGGAWPHPLQAAYTLQGVGLELYYVEHWHIYYLST